MSEQPTRTEVANITETLAAHAQTLTKLAALPALLERLQQEVQATKEVSSEQQYRTVGANTARPKLSVVEANTEHRTVHRKSEQHRKR